MRISIGYITSRKEPEIQWFLDSLEKQISKSDEIEVVVIDLLLRDRFNTEWSLNPEFYKLGGIDLKITSPKPCIWSGESRITKENWWSKCNSLNTFLCMATHSFICMVDDRCVAQAGFLDSIRAAISGDYIMAGSYEKRHGMTVENGAIKHGGIIVAKDSRHDYVLANSIPTPMTCGGEWLFGCCVAMPLEWALQVNGYPERCDSMSFEDVIFGLILQNNGYPIKFDPRARIIEDRSPDKLGEPMKRTAKERFPHDKDDKAHTTLRWVKTAKRSENDFEIRELRAKIQRGEPFPPVDTSKEHLDWFDNQPVKDF